MYIHINDVPSQVVALNVAFLSMTCQFNTIISSECPGTQVLNVQHCTSSVLQYMYVYTRVTFVQFDDVLLHCYRPLTRSAVHGTD